jgi:hypothetical protein
VLDRSLISLKFIPFSINFVLILDELNRKSVEGIQTSLFLLCLDGPASHLSARNAASLDAIKLVHGGGSKGSSGNRWFDKTVEVRRCLYCLI